MELLIPAEKAKFIAKTRRDNVMKYKEVMIKKIVEVVGKNIEDGEKKSSSIPLYMWLKEALDPEEVSIEAFFRFWDVLEKEIREKGYQTIMDEGTHEITLIWDTEDE